MATDLSRAIAQIGEVSIDLHGVSSEQLAPMLQIADSAASELLSRPGIRQSAYVQVIQEFLRRLPASFISRQRVDLSCKISQLLYLGGNTLAAVKCAADAESFARTLNDPAELRRALTFLGIMLADTGDVAGAIEHYEEALQIARSLDDLHAEGVVWNNLGAALIYGSLFHEAIACFERANVLAARDPRLISVRAPAMTNIALCSLHIDDIVRGLKAAKAAADATPEPKGQAELVARALCESYYTRLLLEIDDLERAKQRSEFAKRFAHESASERAAMQAAIAEGLYEVHAGLVDVGLSRLSRTLERARSLKSALTDALVALVKANEVARRPDEATMYLRELTQHLKTSRQDRAKFHQRLHIEAIEQKRGALEGLWDQGQRAHDRADAATSFSTRQALTLARVEMLERLAVTAELRDDVTGEHLYRVGRLASLLAAAAGCDAQTCFMVDIAARLHDIGKIGIPDGILQKPGKFTKAERELMKTHTTIGAETLADSDIPHMQMAEDIARCHHEWWDGSGYPMGLVGEAIPLHARITALADVFDALTHPRSYKGPWTTRDALDLIRKDRGTHFDPSLTDLLLELIPQLQREYGDLDEYLGRAARESKFLRARNSIAKVLRQSRDDEADPERFETQR